MEGLMGYRQSTIPQRSMKIKLLHNYLHMKQILNYLFEHKTLSKEQAKEVLKNISSGKYNESQIAAFLAVFIMRSITVEEFLGFREALLELCVKVDLDEYKPIDLCGTGGDNKNTFNISTCASFVVAGTGAKVAKHGNKSVTSACGSSDILTYFGYQFSNDTEKLRNEIEKAGICFMHAPLFHPAMKNVAPVRQNLGVKTFFNMLGPVVNPCKPAAQMTGVFSNQLARLYNYLFQETKQQFVVVHALDGYDEISLTGAFKYISNTEELILTPEDLGLNTLQPQELYGGETIEEAAKIFLNVLENKATIAQTQAVEANAAVAIKCQKQNISLKDCVLMARESIQSGKALKTFKTLLNK